MKTTNNTFCASDGPFRLTFSGTHKPMVNMIKKPRMYKYLKMWRVFLPKGT